MSAIQQLLTDHLEIWTAADTEKKTGRGRSAGNAASVYGIRMLRELIFELAAQGRLVEEDELHPAKLLKLGEISEFVMGQAPPGSECNTNGTGTIFVKTGEFGNLYPEVREWTTKPLKFAKKGDVLICVVGATVGKLNLAIDCAIGRSVAAIRPSSSLNTKYLYFALIPFTLRLRAQSRGSAQGVIGKAELSAVQIRFPSDDEQHRIVAKVDELMALCDQLEIQHNNAAEAHEKLVSHLLATLTLSQSAADFSANWQRIAAHFDTLFTTEASIDALKQTLLQLAVMGKLVPQNPKDEPASELLKRIQAEKAKLIAEGKIKKDKPLSPIAENKKPFELPVGWSQIRFGKIIELISGQHLQPAEYFEKPENGSTPYITGPADFGNNGPVPTRHTYERRAISIRGDILVTVKGSGVGKTNTVSQQELAISRQLMAIRPILVDVNYIEKLLLTLANRFQELTVGIAIPGISREDILHYEVYIPPIAEQSRIVAKSDELMEICEQLKSRITAANQLQQKLADVMIEQAVS